MRKVWEELRRLSTWRISTLPNSIRCATKMRFDLEMIDGSRVPKRTALAGNHLTEYIIRRGSLF